MKQLFFKIFFPIYLLITISSLFAESHSFVDLECPDLFHLQQDPVFRAFRVFDETECLGTILNSGYGVFDFYDERQEMQWVNQNDTLYDNQGTVLGFVKIVSDLEWFWERKNVFEYSTRIELFSAENVLLATLEAEEDGKYFVFRDAENHKPLAIALWKWVSSKANWYTRRYVQDWEVMIVNREQMLEDKISNILLIWVLMKHSQKYFPAPREIPYQTTLPNFPSE